MTAAAGPKRFRLVRRILRWAAIAAFAVVVAAVLVRWLVLPGLVERRLVALLEDVLAGDASVDHVDLDLTHGRLVVHGLAMSDARGQSLIVVERAEARFSLHDLIAGDPIPRTVVLHRAHLHLTVDREGSNLEASYREPEGGARPPGRIPHLVLDDCRVAVRAPMALSREVQIALRGEMIPSGLDPLRAEVRLGLTASFEADGARETLQPINLRGSFDVTTTAFKVGTDRSGVRLDPRLRETLHPVIATSGWDWLQPRGSVQLEVEGDLKRGEDGLPHYQVSIYNADGLGLEIRDFPYSIADVQGVTLMLPGSPDRRGRLRLDGLRGTHGEAIASISGDVFGYFETPSSPWVHLLLEGRDVPLDGDLRHAIAAVDDELPRVWDALEPNGHLDFDCLLYKSDESSRVRAAIRAEFRDCRLRFIGFEDETGRRGFPYPAQEVRGSFETHLGVSRFTFTGRGRSGCRLSGAGELNSSKATGGGPALHLVIEGDDVPLDDALRHAMRDYVGDSLWDEIHPQGVADIRVELYQGAHGSPIDVDVRLEFDQRATFTYATIPIPVRDVSGVVRYRSGWRFPRFEDLRGRVHLGTVRLDGTLSAIGDDALTITLDGHVLGGELARAFLRSPSAHLRNVGQQLSLFGLRGEADATAVVRGLTDPRTEIDLRLRGASAAGPALPFGLDGITGRLRHDGSLLRIDRLVAWRGSGWVGIRGEERSGDDGYRRYTVEGQQLAIDSITPPTEGPLIDVIQALNGLRARGRVERFRVRLDSRDPTTPEVAATLDDVSIDPPRTLLDDSPVPEGTPLVRLSGDIGYDARDGWQFRHGTAWVGDARFEDVDLSYRPGPPSIVTVRTNAFGLAPDGGVVRRLGESLHATNTRLEWKGRLDLQPLHIRVTMPEAGDPVVTVLEDAAIRLGDVRASVGTRIERLDGPVRIEAGSRWSRDAGLTLRGTFEGGALDIFGLSLERLHGRIRCETIRAGDHRTTALRIDQVRANAYGGTLGPDCSFDVVLDEPYAFSGTLRVRDIEVGRVVRAFGGDDGGGDPNNALNGRLAGRFRFRADTGNLADLVGVGDGRVTDGRFGSIPAFVTLFNFFNDHLDRLETDHFEVIGRNVHLGSSGHLPIDDPLVRTGVPERPAFTASGDAIRLEGRGTVNFGGELEFRFKPHDTWLSTPIPGLRSVLNLVLREAGQVYVLGTVERVDVQPVVLGIGDPKGSSKQPLRITDRPLWPVSRW